MVSSASSHSPVRTIAPGAALIGAGGLLAATRLLPDASAWQRTAGLVGGIGIAALGAIMVGLGVFGNDGPARDAATGAGSGRDAASTSPQLRFNQERREGPTPNGGAYSIASYFSDAGVPAAKEDARLVEIVEYTAAGESIRSTSARLGGD